MKMKAMLLAAALMIFIGVSAAQKSTMDSANEKNVHITQGPTISNNSGSTATLTWTTDHEGANHVQYRKAGSNESWKSAYHQGGGTSHTLQLSGLQPGQTYEYQILTRDGDVRTSGQFQAGSGSGTSTAANTGTPSSTPTSGEGPVANSNSDKVILYREVGPNNVHTFGTTPTSTLPGFHTEGVAGYILSSQKGGTVPLYRLTSAQGDTLLTTDASEKASAAAQGYQDQGVVGYIATTNWRGTTPLYRMAGNSGHFYTTNPQEHQSATGLGFHDEKTVGYIWTQQ